ncbi:zinc-dependent alcohol dehydrogenase family protein [Thauera sp.]|jgi:propanol-preferring alcohol dehydrogenase|uniref:zinc-dependent alcohol dehydrogenase family protein n=1 Tax=Thauera sp. TaxID=1905334 RepID=UPI002637A8E5|nr:zinc-dependent alcohol dehydrogenase family protein [Thauera sp.]MCK6410358.1 zinc-dependent alcohol dehydrogenase family protein [Thauera sp.]
MSASITAAPATMRAMQLERPGQPLRAVRLPLPQPGRGQVLLRVEACGVCRTDLHLIDGELPDPVLPMVPGHEIIGRVVATGAGVEGVATGQRMGVPWLGWTCGHCAFCARQRENLCDEARFTGYQIQGGYAEYTVADARYCFPMDDAADAAEAAPLLCAGLIGYRALAMAGEARRIGVYGFGAAAHIVAQVAVWQGREVYAFTRAGDRASQAFARQLGACWTGAGDEPPPQALDAALIFAPAGELVPAALRAVAKGGTVVCAGIHMSTIPAFPYDLLWGERRIVSVANLTRRDGDEFLALAPKVPVRTEVTRFALEDANDALEHLRRGTLQGAAVLVP